MPKPRSSNSSRRRRSKISVLKEDMIYFEGKVVETFPGTVFGVEVVRKAGLPPIVIKASLKAMLIKRRVMVIKGDVVTVEINPEDLAAEGVIRGTIVERINTNLQFNPAPVAAK